MEHLDAEIKRLKEELNHKPKASQPKLKSVFEEIPLILSEASEYEIKEILENEDSNQYRTVMFEYFNLWLFETNKTDFELDYPEPCKQYVEILKKKKAELRVNNFEKTKTLTAENETLKKEKEELERKLLEVTGVV